MKQKDILHDLRQKWVEIPGDLSRRLSSAELLTLSTDELLRFWQQMYDESCLGDAFALRGWIYELYKEHMHGKRVLEIGQGLGFDAMTFTRMGATVTCADIVEGNLHLIKRLADEMNISVNTHYIDKIESFDDLGEFDVIYACGSLHNAPFDFMKKEIAAIVPHLIPGGRWIQLAYPKERWEREGRMPFEEWGVRTDGEGTPYCEWYDLDKLLSLLAPATFDPILSFNFYTDAFNWFDLAKR